MLFYLLLTIIYLSIRFDVDVLFNVLIFLVLPTKNSNSKLNGDANTNKEAETFRFIYVYKMKAIIYIYSAYCEKNALHLFVNTYIYYFFQFSSCRVFVG